MAKQVFILNITQNEFDYATTNRYKVLSLYGKEEAVLANIFMIYSSFNFAELMTRVTLLNQFYSTAISDVRGVVNHILGVKDVANRLQNGDISVVSEIAEISHKGKLWRHTSFASKFANFHNSNAFPIMDRMVLNLFSRLRRKGFFVQNTHFSVGELRANYSKYVDVYNEFIVLSGLNNLSHNGKPLNYKDIDNYLWGSLKIKSLVPNSPEALAAPSEYATICSNTINTI